MEEIRPGYVRVSEILSVVMDFKGFDAEGRAIFEQGLSGIDKEVLKAKAELGTAVHNAISASTRDEFYPTTDAQKPYLESYKKWEQTVGLKPIESEMRIYDDGMKYTGAIDMLGQIEGSKQMRLIDFKCTANENPHKWPLQATFYHLLLSLKQFSVSNKVIFLQLDKTGKLPKVHEYEVTGELMTAAISAYNLYKFLTRK